MILTHRPVPHAISASFGTNATAGVSPDQYGTTVQQLVYLFGNYQPVGHLATDFACPEGTPIVAAAPGTVAYAGPGQNMPKHIADKYGYIFGPAGADSGNITIIDHGDGSATAYSHQKTVQVSAGQRVNGGQQIGLSGKTGRITGAHLHFEYISLPVNYGNYYYSRSDPMRQYGSASIMPTGTAILTTEPSEEDFMAGTIDAQQAEDIAQRAAELVVAALDNKVRIHPVQAESIVAATTARTVDGVDARSNGKVINLQQADDIAKAAARYGKESK